MISSLGYFQTFFHATNDLIILPSLFKKVSSLTVHKQRIIEAAQKNIKLKRLLHIETRRSIEIYNF